MAQKVAEADKGESLHNSYEDLKEEVGTMGGEDEVVRVIEDEGLTDKSSPVH